MKTKDRIFNYIVFFMESWNGLPPTIREIVAGAQVSSTSVVAYNLDQLEDEGRIKRHRWAGARNIILPGSKFYTGEDHAQE